MIRAVAPASAPLGRPGSQRNISSSGDADGSAAPWTTRPRVRSETAIGTCRDDAARVALSAVGAGAGSSAPRVSVQMIDERYTTGCLGASGPTVKGMPLNSQGIGRGDCQVVVAFTGSLEKHAGGPASARPRGLRGHRGQLSLGVLFRAVEGALVVAGCAAGDAPGSRPAGHSSVRSALLPRCPYQVSFMAAARSNAVRAASMSPVDLSRQPSL